MKDKNKGKRRIISIKGNVKAYYALAAVIAVLIVMILCLTLLFRINNIKVEGVTLYREDQIISVGGVEKQMNLVRTDTSKIVDRLLDNLVYIDDVKVTKKYPSTVVISCTEAVKAADIEYKDAYYVLSSSGRILEAKNPKPTGDIPVVSGFDLKSLKPGEELASEDGFKADILIELLSELSEQNYENIISIDMTTRANIVINYDDRIEIKLGSSADIEYKLSYFKAVIDSLTSDYEGTLIYNGSAGVSAIPKDKETEIPVVDDSSSQADDSSAVSADAQWTEDNRWGDDTWNNGYNDGNAGDGDNTADNGYGDGNAWGEDNTADNGYGDGNAWGGDNAAENGYNDGNTWDNNGYDAGYTDNYGW
ncbi:MAG: FtsQ-type POTRA domain-containing protein [Ruminococcus sp.]|nr:FtsQ-type POTRA domain-containing protein [Ruminococcus sp.]